MNRHSLTRPQFIYSFADSTVQYCIRLLWATNVPLFFLAHDTKGVPITEHHHQSHVMMLLQSSARVNDTVDRAIQTGVSDQHTLVQISSPLNQVSRYFEIMPKVC